VGDADTGRTGADGLSRWCWWWEGEWEWEGLFTDTRSTVCWVLVVAVGVGVTVRVDVEAGEAGVGVTEEGVVLEVAPSLWRDLGVRVLLLTAERADGVEEGLADCLVRGGEADVRVRLNDNADRFSSTVEVSMRRPRTWSALSTTGERDGEESGEETGTRERGDTMTVDESFM
jgi:hypothetical protein